MKERLDKKETFLNFFSLGCQSIERQNSKHFNNQFSSSHFGPKKKIPTEFVYNRVDEKVQRILIIEKRYRKKNRSKLCSNFLD